VLSIKNKVIPTAAKLETDFNEEKERLNIAINQANEIDDVGVKQKVNEINEKIEKEMLCDIEDSLKNASIDPEDADNCQKRLIVFQEAIDEIGDNAHIPMTIKNLQELLDQLRGVIEAFGDPSDKTDFLTMEREINDVVIPSKNPNLIREKTDELRFFGFKIMSKRPEFWMELFYELEKVFNISNLQKIESPEKAEFILQEARKFLEMGNISIQNGDTEQLKFVVVQLQNLVPVEVSDNIISILTKG